jgi:hypothetical protein
MMAALYVRHSGPRLTFVIPDPDPESGFVSSIITHPESSFLSPQKIVLHIQMGAVAQK